MSNKTTTTIIAFMAGAAVGAAVGVLFAPEEGKSTRDKLSYQLSRYREKITDMLQKLRNDANNGLNEAKEEGQKVITDVTREAEEMLNTIDDLMSQIKNNK
jgi:gas vesicle protein